MLIEFSVANFKSFRDLATLSMEPSSGKELSATHTFRTPRETNLLRSAAVYGSNASGKSNLMEAFGLVRRFVIGSAKDIQAFEKIAGIEPFRLSIEQSNEASYFQLIFLCDEVQYRYGFEISPTEVESEWLYATTTGKEARLFTRDGQIIKVGEKLKSAEILKSQTKKNSLFLSVAAQFNNDIAQTVLAWFTKLNVILGTEDRNYLPYTVERYQKNSSFRKNLIKTLQLADLGIEALSIEQRHIRNSDLPLSIPSELRTLAENAITAQVQTQHAIYDKNKNAVGKVEFDLAANESAGTQKMFHLAGPIDDTLERGLILVIDEFDAKLHPLLAEALIKLFNSPKSNPNNAQLIIATHTTHLLQNDILRRDQIWFVEKDAFGASDLYSLIEYRDSSTEKIRPDAAYEKNYYQGRYGGTPKIGNLESSYEQRLK